MKPFLGIDLTFDKKNETMNGEEFVVARPSAAMAQTLERSMESAENTVKKSELSLPIRISRWIFGAIGVLALVGILRALQGEDRVTLAQAYENASWIFWLGGVCLVLWVLLKIIGARKEKAVLETDESQHTLSHFDRTCAAVFTELAVPETAKEIDLLCFFYKDKNGEVKVVEKGLQLAPYINPLFRAFADDECLYLANLEARYAFPRTSIKALKTVKKTVRIVEWNKDEPHNKGIYKPYKLDKDQYGSITCKWYHILEVERDGEVWGIYIPSYELPVFEELTGLKAETI